MKHYVVKQQIEKCSFKVLKKNEDLYGKEHTATILPTLSIKTH